MSLLFIDSCGDHDLSTGTPAKYSTGSLISVGLVSGRHGYGYGVQGPLRKNLANIGSEIAIFGLAFRLVSAAGTLDDTFLTVLDGANQLVRLKTNVDGALLVYQEYDNAILGQSVNDLVRADQWYYVEWEVQLDNSGAYTKVWLDGALVIDETGLVTYADDQWNNVGGIHDPVSTHHWSAFLLGVNGGKHYRDDLYVLDGADENPGLDPGDPRHYNAPLGDVQIDCIFPDGPGDADDWTPSGGSPAPANWQQVDEHTPDADTTYNAAAAGISPDPEDLFEMEDIDTDDGVLAVQLLVSARRTEEGFASITPLVKQDATTYTGAEVATNSTYNYTRDVFGLAPDGTEWTDAKVNAIQMGYRRTV